MEKGNFLLQDCIAVAGMHQTAGLVVRKDTIAEKDAESVRLMKLAGAIPLALTNVSELAMWWESNNCLFGTTKNPYNTRYNHRNIIYYMIFLANQFII